MRLAVAGGTGVVGRLLVEAAGAAGHEPVVLSRSRGVDLTTGVGLPRALDGVSTVVDVSGPDALRARESIRFFRTATTALLEAEGRAGVAHHVALSIVGAAAVDSGYYAGKRVQEELVRGGDRPWSLLRTTQFHEFAQQIADRGRVAGVVLAPRFRMRPVAAQEVAAALLALAVGDAQGLVPDLAGPAEERLPDLVRRCLRRAGAAAPVLAVTLPGRIGRAMRDGALLPGPGARSGALTFDDWLSSRVPRPQGPASL